MIVQALEPKEVSVDHQVVLKEQMTKDKKIALPMELMKVANYISFGPKINFNES